jgi:hypothetical protein
MSNPDFDLIIVGAGFSGLNALAAAIKVAPELKIAVIEATNRVGGHWNTAYPFVRLHHWAYGIGESFGLVPGDGTRDDVLLYAGQVLDEIMAREDLDVTILWDTRYFGVSGKAMLTVRTNNGTLTAGRLIDTVRYGIPALRSTSTLGVLPHDLPALIPVSSQQFVIVGSGKTAMDTLRYLGQNIRTKKHAVVIGGTPVSFVNRDVPLALVLGRAIASVDDTTGDCVRDHMHKNGDLLYFMGQPGSSWRYGFTNAQELADAEAFVNEYMPNMHVEGYERDDRHLRVFLTGGRILEYDKNTVLVDCRGLPGFRKETELNVQAIGADFDQVLYTFITDQTDPATAYTMTDMFLRGDFENLKKFAPPPACLGNVVPMASALCYMLRMARVRRGALTSDATKEILYNNLGIFDKLHLWWIKDQIRAGKRLLRS